MEVQTHRWNSTKCSCTKSLRSIKAKSDLDKIKDSTEGACNAGSAVSSAEHCSVNTQILIKQETQE